MYLSPFVLLVILPLLITLSSAQSTTKPPPPAFLKGLSSDARREFAQIAGNKKISRLDLRNQVYAWADKNGVRSQVEEYLERKNKSKQALRDRVEAAIKQLPDAYQTLNAIGDDDSLTQEEADTKIRQTMAGYSWELKELLRLAGPGNQGRKPSAAAAAA